MTGPLRNLLPGDRTFVAGDAAYDQATALWNGAIGTRRGPATTPHDANETATAVTAAVGSGVALSVCGGGHDPLIGTAGLAADNLLGAEVVLADGRIVHTDDEPDLLCALRGGGGNVGVVTEMRLRPHHDRGTAGGYPNPLVAEQTEQIAHAYGPNTARLLRLKQRFDPHGVSTATPLPDRAPESSR